MEYGLWNLSGGFWAGNTPCSSSERTLYSGSAAAAFQTNSGLETTLPFADMTSSSEPCRSNQRGPPEFVAMKPATTDAVPILQAGSTSANVEVLPVHVELLTELSGQDSCNSSSMTLTSNAQSSSIAAITASMTAQLHKKVKQSKAGSAKKVSVLKAECSLPSFGQQYNPMYSMVFGRSSTKRTESSSESDEDEEIEEGNDMEMYSNASSPAIGSMSPGHSRGGFECGQCDVVADTRPALKKHIGLCHLGSTPCNTLKVGRCDFGRHLVSPGKKQRCVAASLQRVRYEKEEYRCGVCSYTCTIEKAFYKHLKQHTMGLSPSVKISCVVCGKDRPSEVEMNKHMRKHRDSRYFCCDVCVFKTVQLKKLIQHRRMHTGEKPHRCPHCAYRSARRDNLRSHVRRVHKRDNIYCDTFSPRGLPARPDSPAD